MPKQVAQASDVLLDAILLFTARAELYTGWP
jgi:hypothetical protein